MAIGAGELGQHEAVKAIALAARHAVPRAHRLDLVGVHRDHRQPGVQQPLDQQPVRTLKRDQRDPEPQHLEHSARIPGSYPGGCLLMALWARPPVAAHRASRRNVGRRWSKRGPLHGQAQTGARPTSADPQRMTSKPKGDAVPHLARASLDLSPDRGRAAIDSAQ